MAGVEERFAQARREHPEFEGLSVVYVHPSEGGGYFVESSASPRVSLLTALGFTVSRQIDELAGELTYAEISAEQLDLLDRDVVVWGIGGQPGARATIEANPPLPAPRRRPRGPRRVRRGAGARRRHRLDVGAQRPLRDRRAGPQARRRRR